MTLSELKKEFLPRLAPEDFFALLARATGKPREVLLAHPEYGLDAEAEVRARDFFARRMKREPVAYIIGEKEFYGHTFTITKDTLIPRPETECLVEQVMEQLTINKKQEGGAQKQILIADVGTGSGAIIISLAHELAIHKSKIKNQKSSIPLHAIDISQAALDVARENAKRNGVADAISFHHGDLIDPIRKYFSEMDEYVLVANLPYLSESLYASTDDDVKKFEPASALVSGHDGLDHYRELFRQLATLSSSRKHITIFCEISPEQEPLLQKLSEVSFPAAQIAFFPDLSGRTRIAKISLYSA